MVFEADGARGVGIAIVGIGCRFPGASGPRAFWSLLRDGVDAITEIPEGRFDVDALYDPRPGIPGKISARWGGFLPNIDRFDASFFGISAHEAVRMDPQQRLSLEVAYEAAEDAGLTPRLEGSPAGVFVGCLSSDYERLQYGARRDIDLYALTGGSRNAIAGRIAHALRLRGPSMVVDGDRASSLLAVHLACRSLRSGECTAALAGGVNLVLSPETSLAFSRAMMLAADGRCKFGDATADGIVRSEGVGFVVLKPVERAIADNDNIYAVIRGSAANGDGGRSGDLFAPSTAAQEELLRRAYWSARVSPGAIQYVEAHGTGTPAGDPVELRALGTVLRQDRPPGQPCLVGSVKTNIGHAEGAAGIAGLIKCALAIKEEAIPPSLHFRQPSPSIPFDELPLFVPTRLHPWPPASGSRLAGVSAFGLTGTNVHVVLEPAPGPCPPRSEARPLPPTKPALLPLSAACSDALVDLVRAHRDGLGPDAGTGPPLREVCLVAGARRAHHRQRLAAVAEDHASLGERLDAWIRGEEVDGVVAGEADPDHVPKVAFVFSGQGSHWPQMGRELAAHEPIFRATLERCDLELRRTTGASACSDESRQRFGEQDVVQPALFAMGVALAELWRSWGLRPVAVVGHSLGEVAAAYIAGALTLTDAARLVGHRSRLMKLADGSGGMAVVGLGLEQVELELAGGADPVWVAATNSPTSTVLSGDRGVLHRLVGRLKSRGVPCGIVDARLACHSPQVEPLMHELVAALSGLRPRDTIIPLVSTVTGGPLGGASLDARYWARNVREPVRFRAAIEQLLDSGVNCFVEVSPHPVLRAALIDTIDHAGKRATVLSSLTRDKPECPTMLASLGAYYVSGGRVDWRALFPDEKESACLPAYPWQRQRYWFVPEPPPLEGTAPALPTGPGQEAVPSPAESVGGSPRSTADPRLLQSLVKSHVAKVLGLPRADTLDLRRPLRELGLKSLMVTELRASLSRALDRKLPATAFFNHSNIESLARYLQGDDRGRAPADESAGPPATARTAATPAIAVVGMACRFPGGADSPGRFWQLLERGANGIGEVPSNRWPIDDYYHPDAGVPGKMISRHGGFLDGIDGFDADFFGIAPREARALDPQQRLLLEVAWEALEDGGHSPDRLQGSRTGLFIGMMNNNDYALRKRLFEHPEQVSPHDAVGDAMSMAAGRLAYFLGLRGPAIVNDTACSSSLVAVHLACQSLRTLECRTALAGGVNLMISPGPSIAFSKAGMLAPDGRCKTFDASANGYVRSEGCGVVVLKRLSDALEDRDDILAVIAGSAVNQDGRSSGLTAPNGAAQRDVMREALRMAGVPPGRVGFVEAHGTGTRLGDPIEVEALGAVYVEGRSPDHPLYLGAVKTNIGHLEAAAGIAGLIKTVLVLRHRRIPANLHFCQLNPEIHLDEIPAVVPTQALDWAKSDGPRCAAVSSFGFSGTNAHLVLQEAPPDAESPPTPPLEGRPQVFLVSARSDGALRASLQRHAEHLAERGPPAGTLGDLCFSAATGRAHLRHRLAIVAESLDGLRAELEAALSGLPSPSVHRGVAEGQTRRRIAFLFTGQGSQHPGMSQRLYDTYPVFRRAIDRCSEAADPLLARPLLSVLFPGTSAPEALSGGDSPIHDTEFAQPALFAVEYALATLWASWGVVPDAVLGHSIGEYVAACVAGAMPLEAAVRLVAHRGRLIQSLPLVGGMAAVATGEKDVRAMLGGLFDRLSIAALNGPANTVISGPTTAIDEATALLAARGMSVKRLQVSHAFHSQLLEPVADAFERHAAAVPFETPKVALVSNLTGELMDADRPLTATYWRDHLRQPVRFADGMRTLDRLGCDVFLEMGPHPVLTQMGQHCLEETRERLWLASLRRGRDDVRELATTLARMFVSDVDVQWSALHAENARKVPLPTYPFQRKRYWIDAPDAPPEGRPRLPAGFHALEWREAEAPPRPSPRRLRPGTTWLICSDGRGVGAQLAQRLTAGGIEAIELPAFPGLAGDDAPSAGGRAGAADGRAPIDRAVWSKPLAGVVHLWGLDPALGEGPRDRAEMSAQGCASLLGLVQELTAARVETELWLVTQGAQPVGHHDLQIQQAPLWGLGRVIAREHPELRCRRIDLDPALEDAGTLATALEHALDAADEEDETAQRSGRRYVPRLHALQSSRVVGPQAAALDPNGSYLITGGLGGIGLKLAQRLAERGARRLVLVSRRPARDGAQLEALTALRASGTHLEVLAADVSCIQDLRGVLSRIPPAAPLRGVVHAAGLFEPCMLREETGEAFAEKMRAKLQGAWNLHRLTAGASLDFFVLCSSIASFVFNEGLGAYAAANVFLDALAHQRRRAGLKALTINWGPWADVGMLADRAGRSPRAGLASLSPEEGVDTFERLLFTSEPQVGFFRVSWREHVRTLPGDGCPPLLRDLLGELADGGRTGDGLVSPTEAQGRWTRTLQGTPPARRRETLVALLRGEVSSVLGLTDAMVDARARFMEVGLDSFLAVDLRHRLRLLLGPEVRLPVTLVFDYPTVEVLAGFIAAQLPDLRALEAPARVPEPTGQEAGPPELRLSDEAAAVLLAEELRSLFTDQA
jgi:acyl transferase domain-containing protein